MRTNVTKCLWKIVLLNFMKQKVILAYSFTMNSHWNYLDPTLLDHLVVKFELVDVQPQMVKYKSELQEFRKKTPLTLFCETQKRRKIKLSNEFKEIVAEFEWSQDVTLEAVEEFRQEWASHYKFHEFTMMLSNIKRGCFIIAWIVPESVAEKMITMEVPSHIVQRYSMSKLIVGGTCIYPHTVSETILCINSFSFSPKGHCMCIIFHVYKRFGIPALLCYNHILEVRIYECFFEVFISNRIKRVL